MMNNENKRLFYAFEVGARWPDHYPKGRMVDPAHRHLTIAFLGDINWKKLEPHLDQVPLPPIKVGLIGTFDKLLLLPPKRANVVTYHVDWLEPFDFDAYQKNVADWLSSLDLPIRLHKQGFLPHVTICRRPFSVSEWKKFFQPAPLYISSFHLYESRPGLQYHPIWSHAILPPFDEQNVYGENQEQLDLHAKEAFALKINKTNRPPSEKGILTCPNN